MAMRGRYKRVLLVTLLIGVGSGLAFGQSSAEVVYEAIDADAYQRVFDRHWKEGLRPSKVDVEVVGGRDLYDVTFARPTSPTDFAAHHRMNEKTYRERNRAYRQEGFRVYIHRHYRMPGGRSHLAVWIRPNTNVLPETIWEPADAIPSQGAPVAGMESVDRLAESFLREQQIPGMTIAISRRGRIVYSRAFGCQELENRRPMEPATRMRIASVSKPLTGAAIMQLVDRGQLELGERIAEHLSPLDRTRGIDPDPRWGDVELIHLLRHRGGWDRDRSYDPMFALGRIGAFFDVRQPVGAEQILAYMRYQPLDFDPGSRFAYSNFGYSLLGRMIEQVTGQPYDQYMQEEIFEPLRMQSMAIGRSLEANRMESEARYYPREGKLMPSLFGNGIVPNQYGGWHQEALDAHGGWIGTAEDLVRFAIAFDDPDLCPLMSAESVGEMFVPPGADSVAPEKNGVRRFYGCGWQIVMMDSERYNAFHLGSLPGTSSILVRRADGLNWAVLFNSDRNAAGEGLANLIDPQIHRAIGKVDLWPE